MHTCGLCVHMCVQVRVCMCVIYMCALSGWGQTPDTQTRTPCPSCREQRAGPSSSSICLRAQLISPHPSLHLSFLAAHGGGWGDLILPKDPAEGS